MILFNNGTQATWVYLSLYIKKVIKEGIHCCPFLYLPVLLIYWIAHSTISTSSTLQARITPSLMPVSPMHYNLPMLLNLQISIKGCKTASHPKMRCAKNYISFLQHRLYTLNFQHYQPLISSYS